MDHGTLAAAAAWVGKGAAGSLPLLLVAACIIVGLKAAELRRAVVAADDFEARFWSGIRMEELFASDGDNPSHPLAAVFGAGIQEWRRSVPLLSNAGAAATAGRVDRMIGVVVLRERERLRRGLAILDLVSRVAPAIGVLAALCGAAEWASAAAAGGDAAWAVPALLAMAGGLLVGILADLAHRAVAAGHAALGARLDAFAAELGVILSRSGAKPRDAGRDSYPAGVEGRA